MVFPSLFDWLSQRAGGSQTLNNFVEYASDFFREPLLLAVTLFLVGFWLSGQHSESIMGGGALVIYFTLCYLYTDATAWQTGEQASLPRYCFAFVVFVVFVVATWKIWEDRHA